MGLVEQLWAAFGRRASSASEVARTDWPPHVRTLFEALSPYEKSAFKRTADRLKLHEEPVDPYEDAADGLITRIDLASHTPAEIPFHGHTLHRGWVLWVPIEERYVVFYECPRFFKRKRESSLPGTERLGSGMTFARIPAEQLPDIAQAQLKIMHKKLELEVEEEALNGCSIRPVDI
jgi:hypothetical protein